MSTPFSRPTDACPNCGRRNSRVYRVSGLLRSGPRKDDVLKDALRDELKAPEKPRPSLAYELSWQGILLMMVVMIGLWASGLGIWALIPFALAIFGSVIFFSQMQAHFQTLEGYKKQKALWDELYYCYYDDRVFLPGKQDSVPPHRLTELLK